MEKLEPLKVVLSFVDSHNRGDSSLHKVKEMDTKKLDAVLDLARRNGLGYFILNEMETLDLGLSRENASELQKERQRMIQIQRTLHLLNDLSKSLQIDYVTIKTPYMIPHVPRDVDVFVPDAARMDMIRSLQDRGLRSEHSSPVETTLRKEGYGKIDIYSKIAYFGFEFLDDDLFLESIAYRPLFDIQSPILNERASFVLEMLHNLFGHRSMTLLDFLNLILLKENIGDIDGPREIAMKHGWERTFDLAFEEFKSIQHRIYERGEPFTFPHLFDRGFILDCISSIDDLTLNRSRKAAISISLILDELVFCTEKSGLLEALRSNDYIRSTINSIAHSIRGVRGDRKTS